MTSGRLPFSIALRVYWEDTDGGGVVYHAGYLRYFERARSEWLRALGVVQSQLQQERNLVFAIRALNIDFHAPARLDDWLQVSVDRVQLGRASLQFAQSLSNEAGKVLATASVKAACLEASSFRPVGLDDELRQRIAAALEAPRS